MKPVLLQFASAWIMPLLLAGCSASQVPVGQIAPVTPVQTQSAAQPSAVQPSTAQPVASSPQPSLPPVPDSVERQSSPASQTRVAQIQVQRDYDFATPLPSTGQVTIRSSIRTIQSEQLITDCPTDSAPYALAESTNYRIQVCSEEYDPWLPKYYIGQAKDGSGELRITSTDVDAARQLIFENAGYTYVIYRDGARPEQMNAYLEVYSPTGQGYAEALWYLYEAEGP